MLSNVARAAAAYFETRARDGMAVGLACGTTLQEMVECLTPGKFASLGIYPLSVAVGPAFASQFPNQLAGYMKMIYEKGPKPPGSERVDAFSFQVSPYADLNGGKGFLSWEEKLEYLDKHGQLDAFKQALDADIYLLGIGSMEEPNEGFIRVLEQRGIDVDAIKRKAWGEINYQPFGPDGFLTEEDVPGIVNKFIGVPWRHLQEMARQPAKHVIAVASGEKKTRAIRRSLEPDILCYDVLITDEVVAKGLLDEESD